jgi:hypothetical protein
VRNQEVILSEFLKTGDDLPADEGSDFLRDGVADYAQ